MTLACALAVFGVIWERVPRERLPTTWWVADYLKIALYQLFLGAAWCSVGAFILRFIPDFYCGRRERILYAVTLGVVAFTLLMYAAGALGLFSASFAIALPVIMIALGLRELLVLLRPRWSAPRQDAGAFTNLLRAFGYIGLFLVVLQSATPDSIHHDAAWSHLTVAEDYAREGRLVPFPGFSPKNLPHLSSLLYTWAFLVPGLEHPALRWLCAQWIELQLLVFTLFGVSTVAAWILEKSRLPAAWAAFFLFPGFYLYDSNFAGGSDHIAAFFALPALIASMRAAKTLRLSYCALSGVFAGALMHTKFQCVYLVVPLGAHLVARWLYLGARLYLSRSRPRLRSSLRASTWRASPLVYAAAFLLAFGPHLILNWVFYHNPVYPLLPDVFPEGPHFENMPYDPFVQTRNAYSSTVLGALRLMFTFSVEPQYVFGEAIPSFGSLFTLLSPAALLCFHRRRLFVAFLLSYGALFLWCFTYHIDRNLQLVLPWLVAVTAATIAVVWRAGWIGRGALVLLVGLQVGWGARFMLVGGYDRVRSFLNLVQEHPHGKLSSRYDGFRRAYRELGEKLPKDAVLLLHTAHVHLGINRRTMGDWVGYQHTLDYRPLRNARDVYDLYKKLGITHITWNNAQYPGTKQEDVLFLEFVRHYAKTMKGSTGNSLWAMPKSPPPDCGTMMVITRGLYGYKDGLYSVDKLGIFEDLPNDLRTYPDPLATAAEAGWEPLFKQAHAVIWVKNKAKFDKDAEAVLGSLFHLEQSYPAGYGGRNDSIYLRKKDERLDCPPRD